jgi:hypothetical protein
MWRTMANSRSPPLPPRVGEREPTLGVDTWCPTVNPKYLPARPDVGESSFVRMGHTLNRSSFAAACSRLRRFAGSELLAVNGNSGSQYTDSS